MEKKRGFNLLAVNMPAAAAAAGTHSAERGHETTLNVEGIVIDMQKL